MIDGEGMQERLTTLQAENECLRQRNKQFAQRVLDLEAQIAGLQNCLSQMSQEPGLPVEALGRAVVDALALANANLSREQGEVSYTIAELSCDVKGFLDAVNATLTILPANVISAQAADSMSIIRFGVSQVPAARSGRRQQ